MVLANLVWKHWSLKRPVRRGRGGGKLAAFEFGVEGVAEAVA